MSKILFISPHILSLQVRIFNTPQKVYLIYLVKMPQLLLTSFSIWVECRKCHLISFSRFGRNFFLQVHNVNKDLFVFFECDAKMGGIMHIYCNSFFFVSVNSAQFILTPYSVHMYETPTLSLGLWFLGNELLLGDKLFVEKKQILIGIALLMPSNNTQVWTWATFWEMLYWTRKQKGQDSRTT